MWPRRRTSPAPPPKPLKAAPRGRRAQPPPPAPPPKAPGPSAKTPTNCGSSKSPSSVPCCWRADRSRIGNRTIADLRFEIVRLEGSNLQPEIRNPKSSARVRDGLFTRRLSAALHASLLPVDAALRRGFRQRSGVPGRDGRVLVRQDVSGPGPRRRPREPRDVLQRRARLLPGVLTWDRIPTLQRARRICDARD